MSKIFGKKGQAALEFLTTYGWAFMVILVMIGALAYFGVLNPGKLVQDQCVSTAGIECKSYEIDLTQSRMSVSFINNLGKAVTINRVNVTYKGVTVAQCGGAGQIVDSAGTTVVTGAVGGTSVMPESVFQFLGCTLTPNIIIGKRAGDKIKLDFRYEYIATEVGEFSHLASGTITATAK